METHRSFARLLTVCLFIFGCTRFAAAIPVANTATGSTDWVGARTLPNAELTAQGSYASWLEIAWSVASEGDHFRYVYVLTGLQKNLSHFILSAGTDANSQSIWNASHSVDSAAPRTYSPSDPGNSNPGLPNDLFGFKFNGAEGPTYVLTFDSNLAPIWGSFFGKAGASDHVYNNGLGELLSEDLHDFIPVPGTTFNTVVPEPATLGLLGLGCTMLGIWRRRSSRA